MHPRNRHQVVDSKAYDFDRLCQTNQELSPFVRDNGYGVLSIDFADPQAVKQLNKALLLSFYDLYFWDIPPQYLCPPVPGRADYIHHLADLLAETNDGDIPHGRKVKALDIGTGANLIYPIVGSYEYKWQFVGSDIETTSINCAKQLVKANPRLNKQVKIIQQPNQDKVLTNIIKPDDRFAFTMCNPPFHASPEQAAVGTERKLRNLGKSKQTLNFGGQSNELWCEGGESEFVCKMVRESSLFPQQVLWFTSLISNKKNLKVIEAELKACRVKQVRIIEMGQGNKQSRFIAWSYFNDTELSHTQQAWFN
ncbi:MAG: 23S rRNA (adenine(1618)-N(6))-methyltransferase RlmF [Gammaproteobacteria bacterium]|nr:23S rRNA (adenine(1618)-N(6))-methyltransferase RlmF [Gammaproteobacteria bacterium]